jgi:hypothetical protein
MYKHKRQGNQSERMPMQRETSAPPRAKRGIPHPAQTEKSHQHTQPRSPAAEHSRNAQERLLGLLDHRLSLHAHHAAPRAIAADRATGAQRSRSGSLGRGRHLVVVLVVAIATVAAVPAR